MCCEATDALLEYVRRHLQLTGLRNLNAPRRLKLRVPVLKEWLAKQGHLVLSRAIPDWDPVRRPTGRWKSWEMTYLKPIMDEKAVERQAKRALVVGEDRAHLALTMRENLENPYPAAVPRAPADDTSSRLAAEGMLGMAALSAAAEGASQEEARKAEEPLSAGSPGSIGAASCATKQGARAHLPGLLAVHQVLC